MPRRRGWRWATPVATARRKLRWDQLDDEPRLEHDEDPSQARDTDCRSLPGLESGNRRLAQTAPPRQRVLAPWNAQSGSTDRAPNLGQRSKLGLAIALHPVGHARSKHAAHNADSTRAYSAHPRRFSRLHRATPYMRPRGITKTTHVSPDCADESWSTHMRPRGHHETTLSDQIASGRPARERTSAVADAPRLECAAPDPHPTTTAR
jgi:hypothetical protein